MGFQKEECVEMSQLKIMKLIEAFKDCFWTQQRKHTHGLSTFLLAGIGTGISIRGKRGMVQHLCAHALSPLLPPVFQISACCMACAEHNEGNSF